MNSDRLCDGKTSVALTLCCRGRNKGLSVDWCLRASPSNLMAVMKGRKGITLETGEERKA